MKSQEEIKVGDIIARTTIPDRIVITSLGELCTVNLNNGKIVPLEIDEFDVVIGNVYHAQFEPVPFNKIKLLRNNDNRTDSDFDKVREFYRFLTGEEMPKGISMVKGYNPKMSEKKAFSIIWYLQEHLSIFPDTFERCSVCGELFDTNSEGIYWETKGKHYCGGCGDIVPLNYDRGRR